MSNKKPTEKFEFPAKFSVGGVPSGESTDAIQAGVSKMALKKKAAAEEEEDDEEEDEDDEDEEGDDMANLPAEVIRRITAIRNMHLDYEEVDALYKVERIALEKKYLAQKQVVLDRRNKIVSGEVDVPAEPSADVAPEAAQEEEASDIKGIPGFWLTCLSSHPTIGDMVTEEDVPALEALSDITCNYDDKFSSFTLTFYFKENEFFTNTELTKTYVVSPDLLDDKAPALSDCTGTEIQWSAGKDLTVTEIKKKQKAKSGKNKGQVRTIVTTSPKPSFFHYFGMPMNEDEENEAAENEDEEAVQVKLSMEEDYDVGHSIRTSIIPEAVLWYTGEAIEDDGEDDEDDEDDEGLFEPADEDDEDEDDEDEDEQPAKGKRGNKGGKANSKLTFSNEGGFAASGAPAGDKQPECKQN